jgi:putative chitinase
MSISVEQLLSIMPAAHDRAMLFLSPLNAAMQEFGIITPRRQSAFLAQVAHESVELRFTKELATGAAYDTGDLAKRLGNTPDADGDGQRFKGRGLLQITGRDNYARCGDALGLNLLSFPELLEQSIGASRSAAWFWQSNKLNEEADSDRFGTITHRINGGYTGLDARLLYWLKARKVLEV